MVRSRRLIVSPDYENIGLFTTDMATGDVAWYPTPSAVVSAVKKQDRAAARKGTSSVTQLDWMGMPDGFVPPQPK